jgi:hypothetical protein
MALLAAHPQVVHPIEIDGNRGGLIPNTDITEAHASRDRRRADAQMKRSDTEVIAPAPQNPWPAKLLPLSLLLTGTVSTLLAQHVIDRVRLWCYCFKSHWNQAAHDHCSQYFYSWHSASMRCLSTLMTPLRLSVSVVVMVMIGKATVERAVSNACAGMQWVGATPRAMTYILLLSVTLL